MRPLNRRLARRPTQGFTLIEVLVAIVLIHVGLLSLVATSAMLVRRTTETRVETAALEAATNRLETLGAGPCTPSSGAATGAFGLREEWSAQLIRPTTLAIRDSVSYGVQSRPRAVVLHTGVSC
jgi:prepilin-type N-terminal cleavage/methylation domain-containing protein